MPRKISTGAKVAIGLAGTGAVGGILFWALRKAHAAEGTATWYQEQAEGAAARAGAAENAARGAAAREAAARGEAARYAAEARRATEAAQGAINTANQAIAAANAYAQDAASLLQQAAATTDGVRRAALQREAALKTEQAKRMTEQGRLAREAAERATREAQGRQAAEARATQAVQEATVAKEQAATAAARLAQIAKQAEGQAVPNTVPDAPITRPITPTPQPGAPGRLPVPSSPSPVPSAVIEPPASPADQLDRKRQIVADGFKQMLAEVERMNPNKVKQELINIAAARLQAQGIDLNKPNPALAFWKLSEAEIKNRITRSINTYITEAPPTKRAAPGEPAPNTTPPKIVQTAIDGQKLKLVDDAYVAAVKFAMSEFKTKKNQNLTAAQALAIVLTPFQRASSLSPGAAAVPSPSALSEPSAFWANSVDVVRRAMQAALNAAQREVQFRVSNTVFNPQTGKDETIASSQLRSWFVA